MTADTTPVFDPNNTVFLDKDAILSAEDLPLHPFYVKQWKGWVNMRGLTGHERDSFEDGILVTKGKDSSVNMKNIRAKLVARTVVHQDGTRVFTDADAFLLGNKSAAALNDLFNEAQRLSGMTKEDAEELAKNFDDDQSDDSTSD